MTVPLFNLGRDGTDECAGHLVRLCGSLDEMSRFYGAQKKAYQQETLTEFRACFKLEPGDMLCFDNRRVLHGLI